MDCSLPGSSVHRIFQARVLEWGAIAFSEEMDYSYVIQMPMVSYKVQKMCGSVDFIDPMDTSDLW